MAPKLVLDEEQERSPPPPPGGGLFKVTWLSEDMSGGDFPSGLSPSSVVWGERGNPNILAAENAPHIGFVKLDD